MSGKQIFTGWLGGDLHGQIFTKAVSRAKQFVRLVSAPAAFAGAPAPHSTVTRLPMLLSSAPVPCVTASYLSTQPVMYWSCPSPRHSSHTLFLHPLPTLSTSTPFMLPPGALQERMQSPALLAVHTPHTSHPHSCATRVSSSVARTSLQPPPARARARSANPNKIIPSELHHSHHPPTRSHIPTAPSLRRSLSAPSLPAPSSLRPHAAAGLAVRRSLGGLNAATTSGTVSM